MMIVLSSMRQKPQKNTTYAFQEIKAQLSESEKQKEHYKSLAEALEFKNDTILKPAHEITVASGIVADMVGEVEAYGKKTGKNDRYRLSLGRLMLLDEFITGCSKYSDHSYRLRNMLKRSIMERDNLENANNKLKQELEAIKKAFNAE